jgi:uncharacterized membrane-anchored protein
MAELSQPVQTDGNPFHFGSEDTMNKLPMPRSGDWLNKVPEVTLSFWIIKIMSTTVGETGADFLAVNAGWGQGITGSVMAALLAAALFTRRIKRCGGVPRD